jgi:hypothetical protein
MLTWPPRLIVRLSMVAIGFPPLITWIPELDRWSAWMSVAAASAATPLPAPCSLGTEAPLSSRTLTGVPAPMRRPVPFSSCSNCRLTTIVAPTEILLMSFTSASPPPPGIAFRLVIRDSRVSIGLASASGS